MSRSRVMRASVCWSSPVGPTRVELLDDAVSARRRPPGVAMRLREAVVDETLLRDALSRVSLTWKLLGRRSRVASVVR